MDSISPAKKRWKHIAVAAGVKLSLVFTDTIDAIGYDPYIREWLDENYPDYENYALAFWVDYSNPQRVTWDIFLLCNGSSWEVVPVPNPFYNGGKMSDRQSPD